LNSTQVPVNLYSLIEFDLNKYCIDTADYPLDQIIVLTIGNQFGAANVNLYVDICKPGAIKIVSCSVPCRGPSYDDERRDSRRYNIDFPLDTTVYINTSFALNFGCILDPVELTNFKLALGLGCGFPGPCYRNPINNKLVSAYLRGGDRVRFTLTTGSGLPCTSLLPTNRFPITPDIPTIFNLRRRVLDVAVGDRNFSVLVGSVACPNEVLAIGENCYGELGTNCNETLLCFRKINRCFFDCQVERIFAGKHVTLYGTQSYRVYSAGSWKCLGNSNIPVCVPSICQSWKIINISVAKNHLVLLGKDGCIFGFGDNSLGELGLCHTNCVKKPVPLVFFYRLNHCFAKKFSDGFKHPMLKRFDNKFCGNCYNDPCKCQPCTPCPTLCEREEPCRRRREYDEYDRDEYRVKCRTCGFNPCKCDVKYIKYGHQERRKYIANDRCCGKRY